MTIELACPFCGTSVASLDRDPARVQPCGHRVGVREVDGRWVLDSLEPLAMKLHPTMIEHVGGCNPGCDGDDHLLISQTPAGGHDSGAVTVSSPVEREVAASGVAAPVPPAGTPSDEVCACGGIGWHTEGCSNE